MLISFEGIDGSGKSTQVSMLAERLKSAGSRVLTLREPGGTALSERIRALLLDPVLQIDSFAELLLFSAARAQLVSERIRPALAEGYIVVLDRFYDSTTVYQGEGRELGDFDWLRSFNMRVTGGLATDRTYLIDLDPQAARARLASRQNREGEVEADDRMEAAGAAFFQRVYDGYLRLAEAEPSRIVRIDGRLPMEEQHELIWQDLRAFAGEGNGTRVSSPGSSG